MVESEAVGRVAYSGVGYAVAFRGFGELDAAPLARHDFIGDRCRHEACAVAGHAHRFLGGAVDLQGAMHHNAGVVVEKQLSALTDGEGYSLLHYQTVVDMIWFSGIQFGVGGIAHVAFKARYIAPRGFDRHAGGHSVGHEVDMRQHVGGLFEAVFSQCGLDEDENRVVGADFNVVELASAHTVDVDAEHPSGVVAECYPADIYALAVAVIDDVAVGGRCVEREEVAHPHRVGRE